MTDKIILQLTLDELKLIDKYVELNDETQSVFDKIKVAYPQPRMTLQQEGEYAVVSYQDKTYYRLGNKTTFSWWRQEKNRDMARPWVLIMISDGETERLLEGLYYNHIVVKKETAQERGERVHKEMEAKKLQDKEWNVDVKTNLKPHWEPTPQTPEQVADGLKEAFREAVKQGVVSSTTKPQTLYDVIADWWDDTFTNRETSLQDLVDAIEDWLPKEHETNSYKWNECIRMIREKLR